jgi:hypothetical protein
MGTQEDNEVVDALEHPCQGSFLTLPGDTTVGEFDENNSDPQISRTTCPMKGDVGNLPGQSSAELYGRTGWPR